MSEMQQPASLITTPTTSPEELQVRDSDGNWVPLGSFSDDSILLSGRSVFDSITDIEASRIPASLNNILCLSHSEPGDLEGRPMALLRTNNFVNLVSGRGLPSAKSNYGQDYAFYAFDNSGWGWAGSEMPNWLQYQFYAPTAISAYSMQRLSSSHDNFASDDYSPAAWQFQASNDGTTWTTLDTQTGQVVHLDGPPSVYSFANATPHAYYRIYFTATTINDIWINVTHVGFGYIGVQPGGAQSADGAYWGLTNNPVIPQMFGAPAVGNSNFDDYPAINNALIYCWQNGATLHFPAGNYYSSGTMEVVAPTKITGDGTGVYLTNSTTINFPAGITGINVGQPVYVGSWGVAIDGLDLIAVPSPGVSYPDAHGIYTPVPVSLHRVNVYSFGSNGFHLKGWNNPPPDQGSTDLSKLDECTATGCGRNGFYAAGQDANVITFIKCSAGSNGWYGFLDDSFLGNNYISCHSATNGSGHGLTTGVDPNICYYNGVTYCVVPIYRLPNGGVTSDYSACSTTTPGTNNSVWWPVTKTTSANNWVSGQIYCPGGPYGTANLNARTEWFGCYAEGTSYVMYVGASNAGIFGGLLSCPIAGPNWSAQGTPFQYNGITTQWSDSDAVVPGTTPYASRFNSFGVKDLTGFDRVMTFRAYSGAPGPGYTGFQATMSPFTGDWNFSNNPEVFAYTGYTITGQYTTHKFNSPDPQPWVVSIWKLGLSELGDDGIVITYGAVSPQGGGGSAGLGWIVFNTNPTPGGNIGWVCTKAGNNASTSVWKPFGTIGS